jgi:MFS-type transporter involved in bile tolerance (Atg22 family)
VKVAGYRVVFGLGGVIVAGSLLLVRRRVGPSESFAFSIDLRRTAPRTALAFSGQGGVDGILSAATPLGSFLFTTNSFELGLLFALFSLAAGVAAVLLGRASDRVRTRAPFLLLGPILSVPACILAFAVRDLRAFAFAVGWLSMTSAVAPSFIFTILVDRTEDSIPTVTATRELLLNTSRTLALVAGLVVLAFGGDVYALYVLVGGVILLEALAK